MSTYDIAGAFEAIENELINSMMRNFKRHRAEELVEGYNWSMWQADQLESLEAYRVKNRKKFSRQFASLNKKIDEMLKTARADGNASQEAEILQRIADGFKTFKKAPSASSGEFFRLNDRKLDSLIKATHSDLRKAEHAVLRRSNDVYRQAIFNAQVYANTGAGTYEKAVDMACRDFLNAGLQCVEYKNGSRHTLEEYARMAIRTANKRAYLMGEGEKRAEWGISTVVVNSRSGGCPLCAPYIGKVFIDDVYSGGKQFDGDYPLLSAAIRGGLFHPNCKDSTSTYYEGITTLKRVTEDELNDMKRIDALEQQKKHYETRAKRLARIAKFSLDSDNRRIYAARAKANEEKAAAIAEKLPKTVDYSADSGIIRVGNNTPRNIELEKIISKCINLPRAIFDNQILGERAQLIVPLKESYDVVLHGTSDSAFAFGTRITPKILANIIQSRNDYTKGTTIRLLSCNTGRIREDNDCFAQKLADLLQVPVIAPDNYLWVFQNGALSIGSRPNSFDGKMITFFPSLG